ncbi:MAG: hypothetical protein AB1Z98_00865 [Nannocystaceae bacterium]
MSDSSLSSQPRAPDSDGAHVSGEIVREQTVRAPIPTAPAPAVSGETVRAPIPVAPGEELLEAELLELEPVDEVDEVDELEAVELIDAGLEVGRADPPAVSGEVVAPEPEPDPEVAPRLRRSRTLRSGEVPGVVPADPMTSSGAQVMGPAVAWQRPSTDPGSLLPQGLSEITGPQPLSQAETTGPHAAMGPQRGRSHSYSDNVLWIVAGVLVLLAAVVLGFVLTR